MLSEMHLNCALLCVAILQQLDHDIVELDEAHIQPLRVPLEVRMPIVRGLT
jgi:hypothetical protein